MDSGRRLDALRTIQRLLDEAFRIPGTRTRFGWDPLIGLIPWVGDALTGLLSCVIVLQASRMRVSRIVQLRMLFNIAIDVLVGLVPIAGDVADVFWKANTRNMRLLERHAAVPGPARAGDWVFVSAVLATVLAIAVVPLLVLYAVFRLIAGH